MSFGFTFFHPSDLYSFLGVGACYLDDSTVEAVFVDVTQVLESAPSPESASQDAPDSLADAAALINGHAELSQWSAVQTGRVLHVSVGGASGDRALPSMVKVASDMGLCLTMDGIVVVNATGDSTACTMLNSQDAVTLHVDRQSVRSVLDADIAARRDSRGHTYGFPFVVIQPVSADTSPIREVRFVQAAKLDGGWVVEYRSGTTMYNLDAVLGEVEDVIGYIGEFLDGDAAFLDHS